MKLSNNKKWYKSKRSIIVIFIIIGLMVVSSILLLTSRQNKSSQTQTVNTSDTTNERTKASSATVSPNVDNSKNTSEIPVSSSVSISAINLSQDDQNVTYSTTITHPGSTGTCSAVFTAPNARPVTRVTTTSSESCGPISIPNVEFTTLGQWTLTLRYYTNDTQAVSTKTISIR